MDFLEEFNLDQFSQDDPFGSFLQNSGDDVFSVGKLFPGDSWTLKEGPDSSENVLEDVLAQDKMSDPLGQDWMESSSMDLFSVLGVEEDKELACPVPQVESLQPVKIQDIVEMEQPDTVEMEQLDTAEMEPPEIVKVDSGSHILHNLLTLPIQQLTTAKLHVTNIADMDMLDMLVDDKVVMESQFESSSSVTSVVPEINLDTTTDSGNEGKNFEINDMSHDQLFADCTAQIMSSPLTVDEVESILSGSEPASPESQSAEEEENGDDEDYEPHSSSYTKSKKSTSRKARTTPYSVPSEGLSKKERKKLQNKNAAIRYREKKRGEMSVVKSEEQLLSEKNKELKEKVEQISREIQYMKDLMAEVCKAKGIKITFKKVKN